MYGYTNKMYFGGLIGQLGLTEPSYYYYLNQSGTYSVDGTNDVKEYEETRVSTVLISLANVGNFFLVKCYYPIYPGNMWPKSAIIVPFLEFGQCT